MVGVKWASLVLFFREPINFETPLKYVTRSRLRAFRVHSRQLSDVLHTIQIAGEHHRCSSLQHPGVGGTRSRNQRVHVEIKTRSNKQTAAYNREFVLHSSQFVTASAAAGSPRNV